MKASADLSAKRCKSPPNKALQLTRRHFGRLSGLPRVRLYCV
jgi:hypothetical protein